MAETAMGKPQPSDPVAPLTTASTSHHKTPEDASRFHPSNLHQSVAKIKARLLPFKEKGQVPVRSFPKYPSPRMSIRVIAVDVMSLLLIAAVVYVGIIRSRDIGDMYSTSAAIQESLIETSMTTRSTLPGAKSGNLNAYFKLTYKDVINIGDLTSYLNDVFVPQMFLDESTSEEERGNRRVFGDSIPVSPIRFGATKVRNNTCEAIEVTLAPGYAISDGSGEHVPCWGAYGSANKFRDNFIGKYPFLEDGACAKPSYATHFLGTIDNYGCDRNAKDVYFNSTKQEVWKVIQAMFDDGFISPLDTRLFSIEFYIFSPATEVFARMTMMVEISSGGGFFSTFTIQFIRTQFTATTIQLFVSFALILILIAIRVGYSFYNLRFIEFVRNIYVDILMAMTVVVLAGLTGTEGTSTELEQSIYELAKGNITSTFQFHQDLADATDIFIIRTWIIAFLVALVVIKVLTLCRMSMRLYIFVLTFRSAFYKLMAILVLFVVAITGFAIVGVILFGPSVREFRSMGYAFNTLFQILLGDTDVYAGIRNVSIVASIIFFWAFIVALLIVLLNLVVAVLIDSFENTAEANRGLTLKELFGQYDRRIRLSAYFVIYGDGREFLGTSVPHPTRMEIELEKRLKYGDTLPEQDFRNRFSMVDELQPELSKSQQQDIAEAEDEVWWNFKDFTTFVMRRNGLWKEFHHQHTLYNKELSSAVWHGYQDVIKELLPSQSHRDDDWGWYISRTTHDDQSSAGEKLRSRVSYAVQVIVRKYALAPLHKLKSLWHAGKTKTHGGKRFGNHDVTKQTNSFKHTSPTFQVRLLLDWAEICEESEKNVVVIGEKQELKLLQTLDYVLENRIPVVIAKATQTARMDARSLYPTFDSRAPHTCWSTCQSAVVATLKKNLVLTYSGEKATLPPLLEKRFSDVGLGVEIRREECFKAMEHFIVDKLADCKLSYTSLIQEHLEKKLTAQAASEYEMEYRRAYAAAHGNSNNSNPAASGGSSPIGGGQVDATTSDGSTWVDPNSYLSACKEAMHTIISNVLETTTKSLSLILVSHFEREKDSAYKAALSPFPVDMACECELEKFLSSSYAKDSSVNDEMLEELTTSLESYPCSYKEAISRACERKGGGIQQYQRKFLKLKEKMFVQESAASLVRACMGDDHLAAIGVIFQQHFQAALEKNPCTYESICLKIIRNFRSTNPNPSPLSSTMQSSYRPGISMSRRAQQHRDAVIENSTITFNEDSLSKAGRSDVEQGDIMLERLINQKKVNTLFKEISAIVAEPIYTADDAWVMA